MDLTSTPLVPHGALNPGRTTERRIKEATQEFEAILIASLLREVRTTDSGGLFPSGISNDIYRQFFDEEVAKAIAKGGGLGVGKMLERQLRGLLLEGPQKNLLKDFSQPADFTMRGRHGVSPIKGAAQ